MKCKWEDGGLCKSPNNGEIIPDSECCVFPCPDFEPADICEWAQQDQDFNDYGTSCGHFFTIYEDTPEENGFRYCPYCGKPLRSVPAEQDAEEEGEVRK